MTARILIVDDVPANNRLLEARLSAEYYQVQSARDGFEALALAAAWQPDLILLDIMMPGMDGCECCRALKSNPDTRHIPVVMVTALEGTADRLSGLDAGADDILAKPVDFQTLLTRLRSLIRLKRLLDEYRARCKTAWVMGLGADDFAPPPITGATVLVVADNDHEAAQIAAALRQEGLRPARARTLAEAIVASAHAGLDLIVLDLALADDDPLRFAAYLRAADATHTTPLLLIGEATDRGQLLRGFDLGANDWVLRPLDPHELRLRARNQVRRKFYQDRLRADLGQALEMAINDPLTRLYNRRYLTCHLAGLLEGPAAARVALLMIDIDHFKRVNDELGHIAGDRVLTAVADTLRLNVRAFDTLARYGGEEFVLLMPGAGMDEATAAAERLRAAVAEQALPRGPALTISVGVVSTEHGMCNAESLLAAADHALYAAKRAGRDRVELGNTRNLAALAAPLPPT